MQLQFCSVSKISSHHFCEVGDCRRLSLCPLVLQQLVLCVPFLHECSGELWAADPGIQANVQWAMQRTLDQGHKLRLLDETLSQGTSPERLMFRHPVMGGAALFAVQHQRCYKFCALRTLTFIHLWRSIAKGTAPPSTRGQWRCKKVSLPSAPRNQKSSTVITY